MSLKVIIFYGDGASEKTYSGFINRQDAEEFLKRERETRSIRNYIISESEAIPILKYNNPWESQKIGFR